MPANHGKQPDQRWATTTRKVLHILQRGAGWPVPLLFMALALHPPLASPASICRWVDERGQTQMSDVVPDAYKQSALCSDSHKDELSPAQQREAEQRATGQQVRAQENVGRPSLPPGPPRAAPLPIVKRPTEVITDATDCPTRWRIYDESVACFGPHRTTRGATKQEGFDQCNDIPSPELKCGPRSN